MLFSSWLRNWKRTLERRSPQNELLRSRPTTRRLAPRLCLEILEDRTLLSSFLVTSTGDNGGVNPAAGAGTGTLRQAIVDANVAGTGTATNPDLIQFNIPGSGMQTISLAAALPTITDTVFIDGYTQPGSSPNTLATGDNAVWNITLDGSGSPAGGDVLNLAGGNSTVEGLTLQIQDQFGIHLTSSNNVVAGNNIQGTGASREVCMDGASSNTIGGTTPAARNVISPTSNTADGSTFGILIGGQSPAASANNNLVEGNYIGTNAAGTATTPNASIRGQGIIVAAYASGNTIGGTSAAARNIISGWRHNVVFQGDGVTGNVLEGNYIGTDVSGMVALPWPGGGGLGPSFGRGVVIVGGAGGIVIGGTASGAGNLISGNGGDGVDVGGTDGTIIEGNFIGTDASGTKPLPNGGDGIDSENSNDNNEVIEDNTIAFNSGSGVEEDGTGTTIEENSIYGNTGLGIDLGGSGVPVLNDSLGHVGANNYQNFPVLTSASSSSTSTVVTGTFSEAAEPNTTLTLDFYANPAADPSGYGQGQTYLGSRTVVTDGNGNVGFTADLALGALAGDWISATATVTDATSAYLGDTSEFSQDIQATSAPNQTFAQSLAAALPQSTTSPNTLTIQADATSINDVVSGLSTSNLGSSIVSVSVYLNLAPGMYSQQTIQAPQGMTLYINGQPGTTIDPASAAFSVASGNVVVSGVTFVTTGDAPTILVTGGSLTIRNDTIQESTDYSDAAISVTGGTVDLGTASAPGGNTIIVNGAGTFIGNTTANPIAAVGDTFELTVATNSSLMLAGNNPPPLTGAVNGTPFTGTINYPTGLGGSVTVTLSTTATSGSAVGQYPISAQLSALDDGNSYIINPATSATGTMYVVSVGRDPNGTGAQAVTFWDSKGNARLITAADLSSLDALNLVTQGGSAFDPHSVAQLQAWLSLSPNATPAYQLAVQLAVLDLNVLAGDVQATDLVFAGGLLPYASAYGITGLTSGGFIDIQDLIQAVNALLAQVSPGAPAHDPNQAFEAALAQVLQAVNSNSDFVT